MTFLTIDQVNSCIPGRCTVNTAIFTSSIIFCQFRYIYNFRNGRLFSEISQDVNTNPFMGSIFSQSIVDILERQKCHLVRYIDRLICHQGRYLLSAWETLGQCWDSVEIRPLPGTTRPWTAVRLLLAYRLRLWPTNKPTAVWGPVFTGVLGR